MKVVQQLAAHFSTLGQLRPRDLRALEALGIEVAAPAEPPPEPPLPGEHHPLAHPPQKRRAAKGRKKPAGPVFTSKELAAAIEQQRPLWTRQTAFLGELAALAGLPHGDRRGLLEVPTERLAALLAQVAYKRPQALPGLWCALVWQGPTAAAGLLQTSDGKRFGPEPKRRTEDGDDQGPWDHLDDAWVHQSFLCEEYVRQHRPGWNPRACAAQANAEWGLQYRPLHWDTERWRWPHNGPAPAALALFLSHAAGNKEQWLLREPPVAWLVETWRLRARVRAAFGALWDSHARHTRPQLVRALARSPIPAEAFWALVLSWLAGSPAERGSLKVLLTYDWTHPRATMGMLEVMGGGAGLRLFIERQRLARYTAYQIPHQTVSQLEQLPERELYALVEQLYRGEDRLPFQLEIPLELLQLRTFHWNQENE